jgi:predicted PolB exonuclease-like 3'-5' exonuclease
MASGTVRYLVFDIESVADGDLIAKVRYPNENLSGPDAIKRYTAELVEKFGSEFIPYTYHLPISIAVVKIDAEFNLMDIVTLDAPEYRPHIITKHFWDGWKAYHQPSLVSFNGRTFDLPLLELSAYRFGIAIPEWFNIYGKTWEQPRARYNQAAHLDLQDILTNFGATRLNGGLNLVANLVGSPGKMGIAGHMVQQLYDDGEINQINDYCRCDVLDTYFVLLRTAVLMGQLTIEQEQERVSNTKQWLEEQCEQYPVYSEYLAGCNQWQNPWQPESTDPESEQPTASEEPTAPGEENALEAKTESPSD